MTSQPGYAMESSSGDAEEDDEPSSSWNFIDNGNHVAAMESQLDQFRQQWRQEIASQRRDRRISSNGGDLSHEDSPSIEEQAKYWFMLGIESEKNSQFYQAIQYYRRAVQLVPDIEFKIGDFQPDNYSRVRQESESSYEESDLLEEEDLVQRFSKFTLQDAAICSPAHDQRSKHIASLPVEIIVLILKWVVSVDLDINSLEQFGMVCRGFYLCARDEELWRLICMKIWGVHCGKPSAYGSYRNMFIQRPHLRFSGCYISKSTYWRHGEASVDQFYQPIQMVEYYRFARFFPEGKMLMVTTPDEPTLAVNRLKSWHSKVQGIMYGYYKVVGDQVTAVLKRRQGDQHNSGFRYKRQQKQPQNINREQSFHLEFTLKPAGKRPNSQLGWNSYCVVTKYKQSDNESTSHFDLNNKSYPPLIFSRVKSYTALSEAPLE